MLHDTLEKMYGPESTMHEKDRVFLFIYHRLIRDWKYVKAVSRSSIRKSTGISDRNIGKWLEQLEEEKMILSHKSKTGKVWNATQYALHPHRFGVDTLWKGSPQNVATIEQENQSFSIHQEGKIIPINRGKVPSGRREGVVSTRREGGPVHETGQKSRKLADLFEEIRSKNPLKNQEKEPSSKIEESSTLSGNGKLEMTQEEIQARRAVWKAQEKMLEEQERKAGLK